MERASPPQRNAIIINKKKEMAGCAILQSHPKGKQTSINHYDFVVKFIATLLNYNLHLYEEVASPIFYRFTENN